METLRYSDFSLKLHNRTGNRRIPLSGAVEISRRCPLNCVHCYNNLPLQDAAARARELTLAEHRRILEEIAPAGCLWLLFTGGEILARKDFFEIYIHAKQQGFLITLFTNGVLLTPRMADDLAAWPPFSIEISLYGHTQKTYESITRLRGSFERCMRGIQLLKERNLPLRLKTMVISLNKHEIWDLQRFVEEDLGLDFKFEAMINPRMDCSRGPLRVRLSAAEIVALDLQDSKRMAEWSQFAEKFVKPLPADETREEIYQCGGGLNSFAIDPYGRLSTCVLASGETYDLRQRGFQEGWQDFLFNMRRKKVTRATPCTSCQLIALCGMCPANGELENQDPESPIDFLCHVAHLRAHLLKITVRPHGACPYCPGGQHYGQLIAEADRLEQSH